MFIVDGSQKSINFLMKNISRIFYLLFLLFPALLQIKYKQFSHTQFGIGWETKTNSVVVVVVSGGSIKQKHFL